MYDPSVGRWLEEDPIGFEGGDANLYRYVRDDPTNDIDPTGESGGPVGDALWRLVHGEEPPLLVKVGHMVTRRVVRAVIVPKSAARYHWTQLSYKFGDNAGKPISGMMFRHALQDNPSKLMFPANGPVVAGIGKSPEYKTVLAKIVATGKPKGTEDIAFTSNDLSTAIGNATIQYKDLKKVDNNNYEVKIRVYDRYNFEFHPLLYYSGSVPVAGANNLAWLSQYFDVINGYDWDTEWITEKKGKVP